MEFWKKDKRSDERKFLEANLITAKKLEGSNLIINHDGNVIQSLYRVKIEEVRINYEELL